MNHYQINDDGSSAPVEAQAKALGWMLDKALTKILEPERTESETEIQLWERMFIKESRERSILQCAIVEALHWMDAGANGKAHSVLTEVLAKLSAMRVKPE
jgi:hypothetical protein